MKRVMIRYRVKPDRVEENEALVRGVYEELQSVETEDGHNPLLALPAFAEFQKDIGDRCEEPAIVTELDEVGSYRLLHG